ncbi:cardiolipin synthase [Feifania hominis]|uniref:Cardiolipin synthase n=1 Tax=Feifania hominis TaxID=2763660 RepID=A0A926DDT4_9FIRM|nr:cardiolipin synthase [Feifania hominis]MBC8536002.1 cardiolipin synthase [Feifania hominis]
MVNCCYSSGGETVKRIWSYLTHRVVIVSLLIALQAAVLLIMTLVFQAYFVPFYFIMVALSLLVVLYIIGSRSDPAYKIAWIIPILALPVFGGLLYLIFGGRKLSRRGQRRMRPVARRFEAAVSPGCVLSELAVSDPSAAAQARYLLNAAHCPPYRNTECEYFPLGDDAYPKMLEAIESAERFIFLEYFIIEEGRMWNSILELLVKKAGEGVDVRLIYDDFGCIMTLPADYRQMLEKRGIHCRVFNPFRPILSSSFNNRDHRKILVVDGNTAFTGGINLADEYINARVKHGHWKDTALSVRGDAAWSFTVMFLSMWDYLTGEDEDYERFRPTLPPSAVAAGVVQPYCDTPLDYEPVSETAYLNLINRAERYVYINTPYLIVSSQMMTALCAAAKSGVDVRITTPHIPDKKLVFTLTRAHYEELLEAGVKIYEYTPGFLHAKSFVSDDRHAVVGTINLDYRSLNLHFECAALLYETPCIADIKRDYLSTLELCEPITLAQCRGVPFYTRLLRAVLRLFAPLM